VLKPHMRRLQGARVNLNSQTKIPQFCTSRVDLNENRYNYWRVTFHQFHLLNTDRTAWIN